MNKPSPLYASNPLLVPYFSYSSQNPDHSTFLPQPCLHHQITLSPHHVNLYSPPESVLSSPSLQDLNIMSKLPYFHGFLNHLSTSCSCPPYCCQRYPSKPCIYSSSSSIWNSSMVVSYRIQVPLALFDTQCLSRHDP